MCVTIQSSFILKQVALAQQPASRVFEKSYFVFSNLALKIHNNIHWLTDKLDSETPT
jgi:hypothetical protein